MRDMKMAIIGLGAMGFQHYQMVHGSLLMSSIPVGGPIENLTVAGSYDDSDEKQQLARDNGIRAYGSIDELLSDPQIDFVTLAVPNDQHKDLAIKAMRAGKHVVVEKPAARTSAEFKAMVDVAEETGKLMTVHQSRRWDDDYATVKKMYEDNYLGEVLRIESRISGAGGGPGGWRGRADMGGGLLFDWGVHTLDQALDMIPGKLKYVHAVLSHVIHQDVDDGFRAELFFENGLSYFLEVSNSHFIKLPRWYVFGADGSAVVEDFLVNGKTTRMTEGAR
ncbi:MAG: Gfo/Idh/MocA family oxidoreductase, partial [Oscillospiraceae bacterium]|nr:Gfo/Idh/MocA family oxidoreductase [Oscillospiraceae bacterium]